MQRRPDQGPYLCSTLYEVQWSSLTARDKHRDKAPAQTYTLSWVFFQRKYFTHHVQIKQQFQQGSFIATEKGENNLQSHNQRQEQSPRAICFCKCHSPTHSCQLMMHGVTESQDKGCTRSLRLWLSTLEEAFFISICRKCCSSPAWSVDTQHSWIWGAQDSK